MNVSLGFSVCKEENHSGSVPRKEKMREMKKIFLTAATAAIAVSMCLTAFAGTWEKDDIGGWWWENDDGTWPANGWQWLDGNQDGTSECYYFNEAGYMLADTVTPDGYTVNADGAWTENGIVQTRSAGIDSASAIKYPAPRHALGFTALPDQTFNDAMRINGYSLLADEIKSHHSADYTVSDEEVRSSYNYKHPSSYLMQVDGFWWGKSESFVYVLDAIGSFTPNTLAGASLRDIYDQACAIGVADNSGTYGSPSEWEIGGTFDEALDAIRDAVALYYDAGLITAEQCSSLGVLAIWIITYY